MLFYGVACPHPKRQFKTHAYLFANTDEDGTNLKMSTALLGLVVITGLVAWLSEFLVDAIDGFTEEVCCASQKQNDVKYTAVFIHYNA